MAQPKSFFTYRGWLLLLPLLLIFPAAEIDPAPILTTYKTLTVTKSGYGWGTVESNVSGISCGSDCTQSYPSTWDVTLTATADAGCWFLGWYVRRSDGGAGGEYTGLGTCTATNSGGHCTVSTYTVDMSSAKTATAYFYVPPTVTFNTKITGTITPAIGGAVIRTTENYAISLPTTGGFLMVHAPGTFDLDMTAEGCDPYTVSSFAVAEGVTTTLPSVALNCAWASTLLSSTGQAFESGSGTGSAAVTIPSSLYWTAVSNATWITVTAPTGTANGNGTVSYSVAANGTGSSRTGTLTIAGQTYTVTQANPDTTAPKVTVVTAASPTASLTIPVTITATDNRAGTIKYLVTASSTPPSAGAAGWSTANPFTYTAAAVGAYTLYGWAKDAAGNVSSAATPVKVMVDQTAPVTTAVPATGTYGPGLTVALTANEKGAIIYYTTNDSTPTESFSVYSGSIRIESTAILKYFAKDPAGNAEGVKSQTYTIDSVGPDGSIALAGGVTATNSRIVSLSLSYSGDADQMRFSNDGTAWSVPEACTVTKSWTLSAGDGMKTVYVMFRDSLDNWSTYAAAVTLDTFPPVTIASPGGGYYDSEQHVILSTNEESTIYYTTNGTTPSESSSVYSSPIPISSTTKLRFFAKDPAGNSEAVKTEVYIQSVSMGYVNADVSVDLTDAVLALQVLSGIAPGQSVSDHAAVTAEGKIGLAETIYILQKIAGLR